jgi:hypothetical protein
VRHFFDLASRAARLYAPAGYAAYLTEEHHAEKKDATSGTARILENPVERETGLQLAAPSVRGYDPGTIARSSVSIRIEIVHRARGRAGGWGRLGGRAYRGRRRVFELAIFWSDGVPVVTVQSDRGPES